MLKVKSNHLGDVQFEGRHASTRSIAISRRVMGDSTRAYAPELLLGSVGACAGHYAVEYLKTRNLLAEGLQVRVTAEKAKNPARLSEIGIDLT